MKKNEKKRASCEFFTFFFLTLFVYTHIHQRIYITRIRQLPVLKIIDGIFPFIIWSARIFAPFLCRTRDFKAIANSERNFAFRFFYLSIYRNSTIKFRKKTVFVLCLHISFCNWEYFYSLASLKNAYFFILSRKNF